MEYGNLHVFIQQDIGEGKSFWVSGYANPDLRHTPRTNVKPTKVTMYKNNTPKPHRVGVYQYDKNGTYYVPKNSKGKIIPVNTNIEVFDTEEEAIINYNADLDIVIARYESRVYEVQKNRI